MTWEEKFAACIALAPFGTSLLMRKPGDWYVSAATECIDVGQRGILVSHYGNGASPQEAVEDHWDQLTADTVEAVVINATSIDRRREVKWNGYMWQELPRQASPRS